MGSFTTKRQVAMPLRGFLVIAVICSQVDLQGQSERTNPTELLKPVVAPFGDGVPKEIANGAFPAHQIIGDLYYVGTADYASFLITAPEGHILINPDWDDSVALIRASVQQLGFRFEDIKIVLISHAHVDHVGGTARIKALTGAQVMVMDRDVDVIEHGTDGGTVNVFTPVKVDRVLKDLDEVRFGGNTLVAHWTPGHTKGCTTWTMDVKARDMTYHVAIVGSAALNDARLLFDNPSYPDMVEDYRRTFRTLKDLSVDVFLASHSRFFGLAEKYARRSANGPNPYVDPASYRAHIDLMERIFYYRLAWASAHRLR
jgi:metallo-beta-lactamase class B